MFYPIIQTKFFIPQTNSTIITRSVLLKKLNDNYNTKLILVSAPAGFGKTTLISEWINKKKGVSVWLSLDEDDSDPVNFLTYFISALQSKFQNLGEKELALLNSPGHLNTKVIISSLINELSNINDSFTFVLDDYHYIDNPGISTIINFLLQYLPKKIQLLIITRKDPDIQLAKYRSKRELLELRANELRFSTAETGSYFNQLHHFALSHDEISELHMKTEGWITGLILAEKTILKETNSHLITKKDKTANRFVYEYLVEEVFLQQPQHIQKFLLTTSILNRFCAALCDSVIENYHISSQKIIEHIYKANLFIIPLDNENCWYRYHHLFSEALAKQLQQNRTIKTSELHVNAAIWFKENNLFPEAFYHASRSGNISIIEQLLDDKQMPFHYHPTMLAVHSWLDSLPHDVLDSSPNLSIQHASISLLCGQTSQMAERLNSAEKSLCHKDKDLETRNLIGRLALARATLAITQYRFDEVLVQSQRALEFLNSHNTIHRNNAVWTLAVAYESLGQRSEAATYYKQCLELSKKNNNQISNALATYGLGTIREFDSQLHLSLQLYNKTKDMLGSTPLPFASDVYLGLARIYYQWNDLETAEEHGKTSLELAQQYDDAIDRFVVSNIFLTQLKLARGDINAAAALLQKTEQTVELQNFIHQKPEVDQMKIILNLHVDNIEKAKEIAESTKNTVQLARCLIRLNNYEKALELLNSEYVDLEQKGWQIEKLRVLLLQSICLYKSNKKENALQKFSYLLDLTEANNFVRLYLDEGKDIKNILLEILHDKKHSEYISRLLFAFKAECKKNYSNNGHIKNANKQLIEPLSTRELEILKLIALGLSNSEISDSLSLALDTIKGHNRNIFGKLLVKRRTEAVAFAKELGIL